LTELVAMLDLNLSPQEAIAAPRVHHQWSPDELMVEKSLPAPIREALVSRGHKIHVQSSMAVSQIVARTSDGKAFVGVADPRAGGTAAGW
jgi:gamma-glutamyltranspeptidase/glutathione hydrolase